ncbi:hypothetical protein ATE69_18460 [Sphingopyxis sp. H071]|nr:hypothetical protein ATE61_17060 [Sphingopyxis sp. H057]KTE49837.1 hypothetical protein ATE64_18305 [Sphingopyxis sp. H073]KTE50338.1 hypothetical protein ATE69_18460 [Sphingopyxis sp. H071]KTE58602.1 hypothetical protein ATE66_14620 [Sphingopyxis sp. H107]KTE59578.1 hypothetical protein ATE65_20440 [Sphingopyxis sp. H100]KTE67620.1 hypothetical protein ATE60_19005 [Sphingopyxis sp. H081]KTE78092.1 hypothetical protein ATE63_17735 [Sphingopyxis sp. H067]
MAKRDLNGGLLHFYYGGPLGSPFLFGGFAPHAGRSDLHRRPHKSGRSIDALTMPLATIALGSV